MRTLLSLLFCAFLFCGLVGCEPTASPSPSATGDTPKDTDDGKPKVIDRDLKYSVPTDLDGHGLLKFMDEMAIKEPAGDSQEARTDDLVQIMNSRCTAAEMIIAGDQADDLGPIAASIKLESIRVKANNAAEGAAEEFVAYAQELSESDNPDMARYGRLGLFQNEVDQILQPDADPKQTVAATRDFLATAEPKDELVAYAAAEAMDLLAAFQFNDEAGEVGKLIETAFADNESPGVKKALTSILASTKSIQIGKLLRASIEGDRESEKELTAITGDVLKDNPSVQTLGQMMDLGQQLENNTRIKSARSVYDQLSAAIKTAPADDQMVELITGGLKRADKRLGLVGKTMTVRGKTIDGTEVDLADLKGKLVVVDFWATWCGPCIAELPNLRQQYAEYHEQGLEVIGVSLDDDEEQLKSFLETNELPWPSIVDFEAEDGNPIALEYGIETIPFVVLIEPQGTVAAIHVRGDRLAGEVSLRIGDTFDPTEADDEAEENKESSDEEETAEPAEEEATEEAAVEATEEEAEEEPAKEEPAEAADTDEEPAEAAIPEGPAFDEPVEPDTGAPAETDGANHQMKGNGFPLWLAQATDAAQAVKEIADETTPEVAEVNPYAPEAGLSVKELTLFLLDMQDKTRSIQYREGFRDAIVMGADRILSSDPVAKNSALREAINAKFTYLHRDACLGNKDAETQLVKAAEAIRDLDHKSAKAWTQFLDCEQRAITAVNKAEPPQEGMVEELTTYLADEKDSLDRRHLRLASSIVDLINLDKADAREEQFQELAKILQESKVADVNRYGRRIAGSPSGEGGGGANVGKPIELAGTTFDDEEFDIKDLKGQVVIVDFWATWCGPCRKAIPELQELYDKYSAKGFEIVSVSLDKDLDALDKFLKETEMPWVHLAGDGTSDLAQKYGVRGIPNMLLVDRNGTILSQQHHAGQFMVELKKAIEAKAKE